MGLSDKPDGKDHTCGQCLRTFPSTAALNAHIARTHESGSVEVLS